MSTFPWPPSPLMRTSYLDAPNPFWNSSLHTCSLSSQRIFFIITCCTFNFILLSLHLWSQVKILPRTLLNCVIQFENHPSSIHAHELLRASSLEFLFLPVLSNFEEATFIWDIWLRFIWVGNREIALKRFSEGLPPPRDVRGLPFQFDIQNCLRHSVASRYDVRRAQGGGGHEKAVVVREAVWILYYKSVPNEDQGEGVKKSKNFADVINRSSLSSVCRWRRERPSCFCNSDFWPRVDCSRHFLSAAPQLSVCRPDTLKMHNFHPQPLIWVKKSTFQCYTKPSQKSIFKIPLVPPTGDSGLGPEMELFWAQSFRYINAGLRII